MRAGQLRHRVIIQRATTAASKNDTQGDRQFTDYLTRHAAIVDQSGTEQNFGAGTKAKRMATFRFRAPLDIKANDQIKWGNRIFQIVSVINPEERNREIHVVTCEVYK